MTQQFYVYPVESTTFKYVQSGRQIVVEDIIANINETVLANHRKLIQSDDPVYVVIDDKIINYTIIEINTKVLAAGWSIAYSVVLMDYTTNQETTVVFQYQDMHRVLDGLHSYRLHNAANGYNSKYVLKIYVRAANSDNIDVYVYTPRLTSLSRAYVDGGSQNGSGNNNNIPVDTTSYYSSSKQLQYPIPGDKVYLLSLLNPIQTGTTNIAAVSFIIEGGTSIQFAIKVGTIETNSNLIPVQNITIPATPTTTQILLDPRVEVTPTDAIWVEIIGTVGNVRLLSIDVHFIAEPA